MDNRDVNKMNHISSLSLSTENVQASYNLEPETRPPCKFAGFNVSRVADRLANRFPISKLENHSLKSHFWFTNEISSVYACEHVSLASTIARIRNSPPVNERRVSIVTGESGLLSCIPELSRISKLIIQVDCDPVLLKFIEKILEKLTFLTLINPEIFDELVQSSLELLKKSGCIADEVESEILESAAMYKEAMGELHCLSSQSRLEEFKSALSECRIQAIEANYFSKDDMDSLIKILVEENLEVSYFNISNVIEYFGNFYSMNPFNGLVQGVENTRYIRAIPLAEDAICAYSSLISSQDHTGTCTRNELFERLYQLNKSKTFRKIARYARQSRSDVKDTISACEHLTKVRLINAETAIDFLRLILAHITKEESIILSSRSSDIDRSLSENTVYNDQDRIKFMQIIRAAES
ncbi:hypothetical protein [Endozoicomonas sp. ALC020]|uniref:hypothetical protein n=2 Tax=unclassified Endozoicomonas TaxID=2644528 RepID=UPI003BAE55E2